LSSYRAGGIEKLLFQKPRSGRPRIMNPETVERLSNQLQEPEGFSSYKEVHQWLTSGCEVKVASDSTSVGKISAQKQIKSAAPGE
jgi:transposase